MARKITVVPYDGEWLESFRDEAQNIRAIFGEEILEIHHIGSTAIPGMSAKPIVDVMPVVKNINVIDDFNEKMRQKGYLPRGEYGLPGRRYFIKGTERVRTHHIHIYQKGHPDINRHLAFRDYLYVFPDKAKEYQTLKLRLVEKNQGDKNAYINGKNEFIKKIEREALHWKRSA